MPGSTSNVSLKPWICVRFNSFSIHFPFIFNSYSEVELGAFDLIFRHVSWPFSGGVTGCPWCRRPLQLTTRTAEAPRQGRNAYVTLLRGGTGLFGYHFDIYIESLA